MRKRILDVAFHLFSQRGFDGTSIRDIADRLGITKAAVYYHFPAKEGLLTELVEPFLDRVEAALERAGDVVSTEESRRALLEGFLDALIEQRAVAHLVDGGPAVRNHPVGRRAAAVQRRLRQRLGASSGVGEDLRVVCALGAIWAGVVKLDGHDPAVVRQTILESAMAALGPVDDGSGRSRSSWHHDPGADARAEVAYASGTAGSSG